MATTEHPVMSLQDRDDRIRAMLAARAGQLDDPFLDGGHAPDEIDAQGVGHCRIHMPAHWAGVEGDATRTND